MSFNDAVKGFWINTFNFKGKASRSEYWWGLLFLSLVGFFLAVVFSAFGNNQGAYDFATSLWALAVIVPLTSLSIRRLRDGGYSPFLVLLGLIPIFGSLALLALALTPSKKISNTSAEEISQLSTREERKSMESASSAPESTLGEEASSESKNSEAEVGLATPGVEEVLTIDDESTDSMPEDKALEAVIKKFPKTSGNTRNQTNDYHFFARYDELVEEKLLEFEEFKDEHNPAEAFDKYERAEYKAALIKEGEAVAEYLNSLSRALSNQLELVLDATVEVDDFLSADDLKRGVSELPDFNSDWLDPEPQPQPLVLSDEPLWVEPAQGVLFRLPLFSVLHQKKVSRLREEFESSHASWAEEKISLPQRQKAQLESWMAREKRRQVRLEHSRKRYEEAKNSWLAGVESQNKEVDQMFSAAARGDSASVVQYFGEVLRRASYPAEFRPKAELSFEPDSRELIVNLSLPEIDQLDRLGIWKYQRGTVSVVAQKPTTASQKKLFSDLVAQLVVRAGHEVREADRGGILEAIRVDGYLTDFDPLADSEVSVLVCRCVATSERWNNVNLSGVGGLAALKALKGEISVNLLEKKKLEPKGSIGGA